MYRQTKSLNKVLETADKQVECRNLQAGGKHPGHHREVCRILETRCKQETSRRLQPSRWDGENCKQAGNIQETAGKQVEILETLPHHQPPELLRCHRQSCCLTNHPSCRLTNHPSCRLTTTRATTSPPQVLQHTDLLSLPHYPEEYATAYLCRLPSSLVLCSTSPHKTGQLCWCFRCLLVLLSLLVLPSVSGAGVSPDAAGLTGCLLVLPSVSGASICLWCCCLSWCYHLSLVLASLLVLLACCLLVLPSVSGAGVSPGAAICLWCCRLSWCYWPGEQTGRLCWCCSCLLVLWLSPGAAV
ncbi:uncharacterized protein LOC143794089 [Ranitomeya variabilis]|uniref:uncharacterized protein LOC143794089 n=1 Tax=Ranitomeya variabilis TaxID=490064 RepID=UPI0040565BD6